MFTFRYQVTEDDYFEYDLCFYYTVPRSRRKVMRQRYLSPVLFVICGIIFGSSSDYPVIGYGLFGIIAIVWLVFFKQIILSRQIRRDMSDMKAMKEAPFGAEVSITFEEEKISSVVDNGELSMQYSDIRKIVIGHNAFYFYKLAARVNILPYRVFSGEEEKDAFLLFLKQKTNADIVTGVTK